MRAYDCMTRDDAVVAGAARAGRTRVRIVVTGGSGKAGRWVVRRLRDAGHEVTNADVIHDGGPHASVVLTDLTDLGQTHEVVAGADAVVHLAAIPAPDIRP